MEAKDEILRIQKMVAEGKVTPEESLDLLDALRQDRAPCEKEKRESPSARERAARRSFYLGAAGLSLAVVSNVLDVATPPDYRLVHSIAAILTALGAISTFAGAVLGLVALRTALFRGPRLEGLPRAQAMVTPVVVGALALLALMIVVAKLVNMP
ncbi:MAG: SHOCT-like domain-containing protein [Planctomycetota bacterium]|jgi:hypothetical protein